MLSWTLDIKVILAADETVDCGYLIFGGGKKERSLFHNLLYLHCNDRKHGETIHSLMMTLQ